MASANPLNLMRALVDYYQGGVRLYAAGNLYPESEALQIMKARGEAEPHKASAQTKAAKAAREAHAQAEAQAQAETPADPAP